MRRRTVVSIRCAVGVFSLVCITAVLVLLRSSEAAIRARHGTLKAAEISHQLLGERRLEQVRLRSSSGLEVEIAILHPVADPRQRRPLVVLLGGFRTGRNAVELIDDSRNVVVAALSYPYQGTSKLTPWKLPQALFDVRRASIDTPAAITLALDFLLDQPTIDPDHVELVGVSLGAPFVCVAGALDKRFHRIWAVHGGAGAWRMIDHILKGEVPNPLLRWSATATAWLLMTSVSPERFVDRIAPRPFMMISARDDEDIPRVSTDLLFDSAREPKEIIWMAGGHVRGSRPEQINSIVNIVFDRMAQHPR